VWRPWTTDKAHQDVVRDAFDHWKAQDIGLEFVEVSSRDEAEIRVGFVQGSNWDPDSIMEYPFPAGLILVLFERDGGELRYQAGDDDSGEDRNATLQLKLFQGREYVVRVRLYFGQGSGETAVMLW
jgi:hypothetical protein